jgi:LysM repeat protein
MVRRVFELVSVVAILIASFGAAGDASAWSGCASSITVQWGDTLSGIARQCGTTVHAIRAANPGLGWWVYAGQVLYIPTGSTYDPGYYPPSGGKYVVQKGDTLGKIAGRIGVSWRDILAVNPQIQNPSLIYAGQVIYLPKGTGNPPLYNPPSPAKPCNCPPSSGLSTLKITYKHGLFVRSEPGGAIIASGLDKTTWIYNPGSIFRDHKGCVWVEVNLYKHPKGYTKGWMLVKDQLGQYFTSPQID